MKLKGFITSLKAWPALDSFEVQTHGFVVLHKPDCS